MTEVQNRTRGPKLRSGPMITSAALVGAGTLLMVAGFAIGGSHVASSIRRWVREMEVPPSELARIKMAQARAAAMAGAEAWQKAPGNRRAQVA